MAKRSQCLFDGGYDGDHVVLIVVAQGSETEDLALQMILATGDDHSVLLSQGFDYFTAFYTFRHRDGGYSISRGLAEKLAVDGDHGTAACFGETGVETHPRISSLLYLGACKGGLLAVTREPPSPKNPAFAPEVHDFDFVAPRANRFTYFDGALTHGVLDANNEVPGKRIPREPSLRLAIAVNFWDERPWAVPLFRQSRHYRGLALEGRRKGPVSVRAPTGE